MSAPTAGAPAPLAAPPAPPPADAACQDERGASRLEDAKALEQVAGQAPRPMERGAARQEQDKRKPDCAERCAGHAPASRVRRSRRETGCPRGGGAARQRTRHPAADQRGRGCGAAARAARASRPTSRRATSSSTPSRGARRPPRSCGADHGRRRGHCRAAHRPAPRRRRPSRRRPKPMPRRPTRASGARTSSRRGDRDGDDHGVGRRRAPHAGAAPAGAEPGCRRRARGTGAVEGRSRHVQGRSATSRPHPPRCPRSPSPAAGCGGASRTAGASSRRATAARRGPGATRRARSAARRHGAGHRQRLGGGRARPGAALRRPRRLDRSLASRAGDAGGRVGHRAAWPRA